MAKKVEDPKKLADKIAKTKALAGGRKVTVNQTPSAGMPGSGKQASLGEVVITAQAKKPEQEKTYQVGESVWIKYPKQGGGSQVIKYPKIELERAFKKEGQKLRLGSSNLISPDDYQMVKYIADRNKVPVYNEAQRTIGEARDIFKTGKSN